MTSFVKERAGGASALACVVLTTALVAQGPADTPRITAATGFAVEELYPAAKSGSILAIAFDSDGRLVISKDRGPIVTLIDKDNDGRVDEERVFTNEVVGCQGMQFDGATLYAVGVGSKGAGLYRVTDENQDGRGDRVELMTANSDSMGEHGPHAVFFGPDGYLYWMLGNHTGIVPAPSPLSPHRQYREGQLLPPIPDPRGHAVDIRAPGGVLLRIDATRPGAEWEMFAGGFRNAYDAAFNLEGELFTFDSDMEWDINMPWYRPVRTIHVVPGGEYGSRQGSGPWPDYYPDSLPPMAEVGRGSPVGVVFYQGQMFPESYRDVFLEADWSRGRILSGTLARQGATYREKTSDFVLGVPLNVTDVDVGPDGAVYFTKGGRMTEGGVYRVAYSSASGTPAGSGGPWLERALSQPQPRSSFGRASLRRLKTEAGAAWDTALLDAVRKGSDARRRVRALELLEVYGSKVTEATLAGLGDDPAPEVRAASTYYLGLRPTDASRKELARRLEDADPFVRRRAAEALVRTGIHPAMELPFSPAEHVLPLLGDDDRFVRYAARQLLVRTNRNRWRDAAFQIDRHPGATEALLAIVHTVEGTNDLRPLLTRELELLRATTAPGQLLALLRVVHLTMIQDRGVNYSKIYEPMGQLLLARFPSGQRFLDREIARTLAHLDTAGALSKIVAALQAASGDREQQIFYANCLRVMREGWEPAHRQAVVEWFRKTQDEHWKGGSSFAGFIQVMWDAFLENQPATDQQAAREAVPSLTIPTLAPGQAPAWRANEAATVSEQEMREYLLYDPMAYAANAERGRKVYEKALCVNCHRFGQIGQEAGPDLTDVARRFKRTDLLEAILHPSKTISDQWAAVDIVTNKNQTILGVVQAEDAQAVTVLVPTGEKLRIPKRDIRTREAAKVSPMPEGLLNGLSMGEVRDLFAFLEKGST